MTVLLSPNMTKDAGFAITRRAAEILRMLGVQTIFCQSDPDAALPEDWAEQIFPVEQAFSKADVVLTIGGDGTLLNVAENCLANEKPVLGVNLGRTGFLATCEPDELEEKLGRLAAGDYLLEPRELLHACAQNGTWQANAVNDIVLYGASRLHPMDYSVYCDGVFVRRYRADGVIVATPTGSTAYSLSAGGPILDAQAAVFVLNGICAHDMRTTPMVFSDKRELTVVAERENRDQCCLCADSRSQTILSPGDSITLRAAEKKLCLISFGGQAEQFSAIDAKLTRR